MLELKDLLIIKALREDGRTRLAELAAQTGIPLSTAHERLTKLMKNKTIRIIAIPDYEQLRIPLTTWFIIKTSDRDRTLRTLKEADETNTLLSISNGADVAAELLFRNLKQQHALIDKISSYGHVQAYPVIDVIKKENAQIIDD